MTNLLLVIRHLSLVTRNMSKKIAYIMSRFPHLPETFILREMNELEKHGWKVALYPLILQPESAVVHADAAPWLIRARKLSYFSREVVRATWAQLRRQPIRLLRSVIKALWENLSSPKFFVRTMALLPKALVAAEKMEREGIAHIHAHYATHPALVAWLIHQLTGITYSVTVHAHDIFVRREMLTSKLKDAAFVVSISEFNLDFLSKHVGPWVRYKTHVVHCGIEPEKYQSDVAKPALDQRLEMVATGSLQPYKGFPYLIEACHQLKTRGVPFRCRIIGGGPERPQLEKLIAQYGLEDQLMLLGAKTETEVRAILATANCYVQPSIITPNGKMEGIPVALMEAMATGLPVVASALSGIPELVRPHETGALVDPENSEQLADALEALFFDKEKGLRMAAHGRMLVEDEFALEKSVEQLGRLFKRIESKRANGRVYRWPTGEMPEWTSNGKAVVEQDQ